MVEKGEEDPKDLAEDKNKISSENSSGIGHKVESSTDCKEE